MQLLYYQGPLSAVCLAVLIPFFEPVTGPGGLLSGGWTLHVIVSILYQYELSIGYVVGRQKCENL